MRNAFYPSILSGLLAIVAAGCSGGGGSDESSSLRVRCNGGESFCLISCDLGCNQTGCSITEIAENQRLRFVFSDRLDTASVSNASVSIRTATGVAPDVDLQVSGSTLTLVPRVRTINGVASFGFQRNETYIITLGSALATGQGVRNTAGDALSREFSCTVIASRGILDEDLQPPTAVLVAPTDLANAPLSPTIVVRFSELVDTTALQTPLGSASPVRIDLRPSLLAGGTRQCDRDTPPISLEGVPTLTTETVGGRQVTVLTFRPTVELPGASCVEVNVTADVRDLSGRQAVPAQFRFFTQPGVSTPIEFNETFNSPNGLEVEVSGGTWSNGARPAVIGNDGRHGPFTLSLGTTVGANEVTINTDNTVIPAGQSLTGIEYTVTDGKFYFTEFVLPEGVTLNFTGTVPPQIWVRGRCEVRGTIKVNAADLPFWTSTDPVLVGQRLNDYDGRGAVGAQVFRPGQPGTNGGPGGGRGGAGGREKTTLTNSPEIENGVFVNNGQPGQDVRLPAGHAYLLAATGTGGRGGSLMPASGIANPTTPAVASLRVHFAPGGTGGGYSGAGGLSSATPLGVIAIGTVPPAGSAFPLFPYPPNPLPTPTYQSLDHFLVGGSGGGGGGSHAFGTFVSLANDVYIAGAGGTGGGGAIALRAGGPLTMLGGAVIEARGGTGVLITGDNRNTAPRDTDWGVMSPGGGGSGGSVLLQSGADLTVFGRIDTRGGNGSRTGLINNLNLNIQSQAGAGSDGFYRLEAAGAVTFGGSAVGFPAYNAAQNSGALLDRDQFSGQTALWRSSGRLFPPVWERYELDVDVDGDGTAETFFTDSGAPGTVKANDINGPVVILFQGAQMNQTGTQPVPGTAGPWREGVGSGAGAGIQQDAAIGFRFRLTFNRGTFPNCVVKALRVYART